MKIENPRNFLQSNFSDYWFLPSFTHFSFLFEVTESSCGGDIVATVPRALIVRHQSKNNTALFTRLSGSTSFVDFFIESSEAYDFACDLLDCELYQSDFFNLSTETLDN